MKVEDLVKKMQEAFPLFHIGFFRAAKQDVDPLVVVYDNSNCLLYSFKFSEQSIIAYSMVLGNATIYQLRNIIDFIINL